MSEVSGPSGCPCGRQHRPQGRRAAQRRRPRDHAELVSEIYETSLKSGQDEAGRWVLPYAGDCQQPISIKSNSATGALFVLYEVRCRRCNPCLRARTNYWGFAAMNMTMEAQEQGLRTWFGTLTLSPEAQAEMFQRAFERWSNDHPGPRPDWWDEVACDHRFGLIRAEILREVQRYWKRLRKAGHKFKYFLVFERHRSGLPHMHFLLHEQGAPIRKRVLQSNWPWGFSNVSIVGGKSARAAAPERAAWYVAKYLSKSYQSRQVASAKYRPEKRARPVGRTTPEPPKGTGSVVTRASVDLDASANGQIDPTTTPNEGASLDQRTSAVADRPKIGALNEVRD